jgi:DNA gyrase subunit A
VSERVIEELDKAYFSYAYSVISERALPDYRDGLKPVQRRILYSMWINNNRRTDKYKKSVNIVGHVMGNFHPHGNDPIYQAIVRMAQPFAQMKPLIDPHGNFGSIDGYEAAAMRYTECRMSWYSHEFFEEFNVGFSKMQDNFDSSSKEPSYLPSKMPNMLINGAYGIAVGVSTSIPTHNVGECLKALVALIEDPLISDDEILEILPGPDFPTGGTINGDIKSIYLKGEGNVTISANYKIEEGKIIFYEIPYQTQKIEIIKELNLALSEKRIEMVSRIRDESDKNNPVRIVFYLKNNAVTDIVINQIFSCSALRNTLRICFFAIDQNKSPRIFSLPEYLKEFLKFRDETLIEKTIFEKQKAKIRIHNLLGIAIAFQNKDRIMKLIDESSTIEEATSLLQSIKWDTKDILHYLKVFNLDFEKKYSFSPQQCKVILDLKLNSFIKIENEKCEKEITALLDKVTLCNEILEDKNKRNNIIKQQFIDLLKYDLPRKTSIAETLAKFSRKDAITPEDVVVILNKENYIKRVPLDQYKRQNLGGKGRNTGASIEDNIIANTKDKIIFFSNTGIVYETDVFNIPTGTHYTEGRALINLLSLKPNEQIIKVFIITDEQRENLDKYVLLFISSNGKVRKNNLSEFVYIRSNGKKYMREGQEWQLLDVILCTNDDLLFMGTKKGRAICIPAAKFPIRITRQSEGVRACNVLKGDELVGAIKVSSDSHVLTVTENGYGKLSSIEDYRVTNRGAKGVMNIRQNNKTGDVISFLELGKDDEVMLMSQSGQSIRISSSKLRVIGRKSIGVKIWNITEDKIVSVERVPISGETSKI